MLDDVIFLRKLNLSQNEFFPILNGLDKSNILQYGLALTIAFEVRMLLNTK